MNDLEKLRQEAHRTWYEYGEVIKKVLGFKECNIEAEPVLKVIIPIQKENSVLCPDDLEILGQETT